MAASYIPTKDADLANWEDNFSTLITANPTNYGLLAGDAVAIAAAVLLFTNAFTVATNPTTRTSATIATKDAQKAASTVTCRYFAQLIRNNNGVSDALKIGLGLNLPDPTPSPIPPPATSPIITIVAATPLQLTLRYADQNTPDSRRKPDGVTALELFVAPSATVIVDPATLPFNGLVTRQPYPVNFVSGDVGKTAYIAGRWVNRKGQVGPWSNVATFTVANG
jgi:hypothetical protein